MSDKKILNETVCNFFSGKKELRSLSNFWEEDVIIRCDEKERKYETGEHCFHGEKYTRLGEECSDKDRQKVLLDYGKTFLKPSIYKTAAVAKKMGGKKGLLLYNDELDLWQEMSITVQKCICEYKFETYAEVRDDLLKTGEKILIHPALRCREEDLEKRIWEGRAIVRDEKVVVLGKNMLGRIWTIIRIRFKLKN
jgi:hypothetical protein